MGAGLGASQLGHAPIDHPGDDVAVDDVLRRDGGAWYLRRLESGPYASGH